MKHIRARVKTAVLSRLVDLGHFMVMSLAFLLFVFLFWTVSLIGHHSN